MKWTKSNLKVDGSGKYATDDTDRPASDDGGSIGAY